MSSSGKSGFFSILIVAVILTCPLNDLLSQHYFALGGPGVSDLEIINHNSCNSIPVAPWGVAACSGWSMTPDTMLMAIGVIFVDYSLYSIDVETNTWTPIIALPTYNDPFIGLVSIGNGLFYTVSSNDSLFLIDENAGTVTPVAAFPFGNGAMCLLNGEIYFIWTTGTVPYTSLGIRRLNVANPGESELIASLPNQDKLHGLSASDICNTLVGTYLNGDIININIIDGVITPVCNIPGISNYLSGLTEFETPSTCEIYIDLDEDDSSGATEEDFISDQFTCLTDGSPVSDLDITLLYDALIMEMTVEIVGFIPDGPFEILEMFGSVSNIDVTGEGTSLITLTNSGDAKSTHFKEALRRISYNNNALDPTEGQRTVNVQFTTASGAMSNIATAYIDVIELPLIDIDLGEDQVVCEGQSVAFNAGNPGSMFEWSNGQASQVITVSEAGEYIVTVSNNIHCPNQDTVNLVLLPVIEVSLSGVEEICDNEPLVLTINTNSPFPLAIDISADPGTPFHFPSVTGNFSFTDTPGGYTEYMITSIIPSDSACVELIDPFHSVNVNPSYTEFVSIILCEGDSILIGSDWETEAGVYDIVFNSQFGCDSAVTFTINVSQAINISLNASTCNPVDTGIFITLINNPAGCDTVVQTTVSLLPSDTTFLALTDCNAADTGVFQQVLNNTLGCDSMIITNVNYAIIPNTQVNILTCDSSMIGVFHQLYIDQSGCDSIVIITVKMAPGDTSYLSGTSCDPASIGVFETLFSNQEGCDSLVINTITPGIPDTTYINTTSCDSTSLGTFEEHFITQMGCDSTVFTMVSYSASDSTFLNGSTCDPGDVGVFIESLANRFGCDSIVTTTISLLLADQVFLSSSTCDPSQSGVFVQELINQFGCDSTVTTTVGLLPSDETFLTSTTCRSSEAGTFITIHQNQYGCDSIVTITISLVPADTTLLSFKTCDPNLVGSSENIFVNQDGCDSLVIEQTTLYPLPELQIEVTSDFNGYAISCFGESDGSANALITGIQPWTYLWSTGSSDQSISGLSVGNYAITITDGNGCIASDEVMLFEPERFSINFMVSQPDCFDYTDGSITVEQHGGIEPIRYSIDGVNYQSSPVFASLAGGTYNITALDANDCEVKEIIWINVPLMVNVELGDDQMTLLGDTVIINAIVNVPFDSLASVTWSGLINPDCPTCLTQPVAPIITTTYSVTVKTLDGCQDEDAMTLSLENNIDIYVPNIFSPNGDDVNDRLIIYAGDNVKEITSMIIFDRWGNAVFSVEHFQPTDISKSWDGRFRGSELNPGVFAYRMIVHFEDGSQEIIHGDISIVR